MKEKKQRREDSRKECNKEEREKNVLKGWEKGERIKGVKNGMIMKFHRILHLYLAQYFVSHFIATDI